MKGRGAHLFPLPREQALALLSSERVFSPLPSSERVLFPLLFRSILSLLLPQRQKHHHLSMTYVQDFNASLAFISKTSMLSSLEPAQVFENKPALSLALAYMYVAMKYNTTVLVEQELFPTLSDLFPSLVKRKSASGSGMTITKVDTSAEPKYKQGLLLMPVYVSEGSKLVYNIHHTDAEEMEYSVPFTVGALNFFNCVVRSQSAGTSRVIWKDPATFSTRLQSANYDRMFGLYLANKYLSSFTDDYPIPTDSLATLAMCIRLMEIVEAGSETQATKTQVMSRPFSEAMIDALIVPASAEVTTEVVSSTLAVDQSKRDLFSVLFYLRKYTPAKRVQGLNLYLIGFKSYTFLTTLAKLFPRVTFTVQQKVVTSVPKASNIVTVAKILTPRDASTLGEKVVLFSNLSSNDAMLNSFKRECVVLQGTTSYIPVETYSTCFTGGSESVAYSVYDETRKKSGVSTQGEGTTRKSTEGALQGEKRDADSLREVVKQYSRQLEIEYRDMRKWMYTIGGTTVSYDEAALRYLTNMK